MTRKRHDLDLLAIWLVLLVLIFSLCVGGCVSMRPPAPASTQPSQAVLDDFYAYRGGYLNALTGASAARAVGKLSDERARELEDWRQVYLATVLAPKAAAALAMVGTDERERLRVEQEAIEAAWRSRLPEPER